MSSARWSFVIVTLAWMIPLTLADECSMESWMRAAGHTCWGSSSCSCPAGIKKINCGGSDPVYYCADVKPTYHGEAKTSGCTCTDQCKAEGWCYADCDSSDFHSNWDHCKSAGEFIADFAKEHIGQEVDRGECWDLANRAVTEARKAGYSVDLPDRDVWSDHIVSWNDAQPGDIMQFAGYYQKLVHADGTYHGLSAQHHTAVVTEGPTGDMCKITSWDQGVGMPVAETVWDICLRTRGSVTIYRVWPSSQEELFLATFLWNSGHSASVAMASVLLMVMMFSAMWSLLGRRCRADRSGTSGNYEPLMGVEEGH